ncbi:MAG: hypothetical protein INH10_10180 [Rhodocyclaceae bacterium]|nr:hypothetical protein [Rhodocyclaceae bacterium]
MLLVLLPVPSLAQSWPARPVRLVVPFPPGGATDLLARQLAQRLGDGWGQTLVVENRGGASGAIATEHVARQPGDGYTLLFATASTHAINPAVSRVSFNPLADFAPVVNVAAAMTDLLGGHVALLFDTLSNTLAHAQSGKLRLLASTGPSRVAAMPALPTIAETLPGYGAMTWFGILGPAALPRAVVMRINGDVAKVLQVNEVRASLAAQGFEPAAGTPEAFAAQIQADLAKWARLVADAKIRVE